MKIVFRILVAWLALSLLFVIFACAFLSFKGKPLIIAKLQDITHKKVTIGGLGVSPLLQFEFKNVEIEGIFKARKVMIAPSLLSLATGNIGFNEVSAVGAEFTYEKFPTVVTQPQPQPEAQTQPEAPATDTVSEQQAPQALTPLLFKHININSGTVKFIDHTVGPEGITITAKDIFLKVNNLCIGRQPAAITRFELKGIIPWQAGQAAGKFFAEGWMDLNKKDMRATLKVDGIDGVYLYPYYAQFVSLQKTSIESAKLDFSSNINGLNDNVTAECHFELRDIVFRERQSEEKAEKEEKITKAVLKFFKSLDNGKIVFNFTLRTKMSRPEFGMATLVGVVENKLSSGIQAKKRPLVGDVFVLPVRLLESAVKASSDLSKAVIDGTIAVGRELKKATQASFTREK